MAAREGLYAAPRRVTDLSACEFYHRMEVPGVGVVGGQWDLRGGEDDYLGHVDLQGKRVLEIGPASGWLTFTMERRGADVVAVELAPDESWDIVTGSEGKIAAHRQEMERLRNGFWLAHERFASRARLHYGNAYRLPGELGRFDVAVLGSVLVHMRDPLGGLGAAAALADTVIVTDVLVSELGDEPVARLIPRPDAPTFGAWWYLTPSLVENYLGIIGFSVTATTRHRQLSLYSGQEEMRDLFTVVARRED